MITLVVSALVAQKPPNVLLFAVDDLRAQFGSIYPLPDGSKSFVQTPSLDALSQQPGAVTFSRGFVQYSHCVVSRASILTARRPSYTRAKTGDPFGTGSCARGAGNYTTLPSYFRERGYLTAGGGKIFHPDTCDGAGVGEDRFAWSLPYYHAPCIQWGSLPCRSKKATDLHGCGVPSWVANTTSDPLGRDMPDGMIATNAIAQLRTLTAPTQRLPWFLAVGFHKPHLPHFAPARYFGLYANASVAPPDPPAVPRNSSPLVWASEGGTHELWEYDDLVAGWPGAYRDARFALPAAEVRAQQVAYAACVSFVDAQVGRVLAALGATGQAAGTAVALFGDHGWHTGEQHHYAKCTNFDTGLHVPLMLKLPLAPPPAAPPAPRVVGALVETVSLFATLADVAGLPPLPPCPPNSTLTKLCTDGRSLLPLLATGGGGGGGGGGRSSDGSGSRAAAEAGADFKVALSQWSGKYLAGYTMRSKYYRYTEWVNHSAKGGTAGAHPDWSTVQARELYLHHVPVGPGSRCGGCGVGERQEGAEKVNVADDPQNRALVVNLSRQLHEARPY